jgi:hypothetical protein
MYAQLSMCFFLQTPSASSRAFSSTRVTPMTMVMDEFITQKLTSIKRTFDALTERLADPDVINDRKQMLVVSRERAIAAVAIAFTTTHTHTHTHTHTRTHTHLQDSRLVPAHLALRLTHGGDLPP